MSAENTWTQIIASLKDRSAEVSTITKNTKPSIWFTAYVDNDSVRVQSATTNKPSAKISGFRTITKNEFLQVYPYYQPWVKGECQRQVIRDISVNTSYIFGLIFQFE